MLKPELTIKTEKIPEPAAFGRLCVETKQQTNSYHTQDPAAFGRLCVETKQQTNSYHTQDPAAFGRLCVETVSG